MLEKPTFFFFLKQKKNCEKSVVKKILKLKAKHKEKKKLVEIFLLKPEKNQKILNKNNKNY